MAYPPTFTKTLEFFDNHPLRDDNYIKQMACRALLLSLIVDLSNEDQDSKGETR